MTTWAWAALPPGRFGLPEPALVMSPWVLEVRESRPSRRGFRRVTHPRQWRQVGPASGGLVLDLRDFTEAVLARAKDPEAVDFDAVLGMVPGCFEPGGVEWVVPVFVSPDQPDAAAVWEAAHKAGRVWLLTGDLAAYWNAARSDRDVTFEEAFPGGSWAASVALATHLFGTGVGTRATRT